MPPSEESQLPKKSAVRNLRPGHGRKFKFSIRCAYHRILILQIKSWEYFDVIDVISLHQKILKKNKFLGSEFGICYRYSHRSVLRRCTFSVLEQRSHDPITLVMWDFRHPPRVFLLNFIAENRLSAQFICGSFFSASVLFESVLLIFTVSFPYSAQGSFPNMPTNQVHFAAQQLICENSAHLGGKLFVCHWGRASI